jgi:galactitol-specific phosphotransferase system IIB component
VRGFLSSGVISCVGRKATALEQKEQNMKNAHRFLIATAALALFTSASQAKAGGTDTCCNDGIAASPKVRAMLDERCKARCAPAQVTVNTTTRQTDVAASPKVQQMRSERAAASVAQVATETASYQPTGSDGITASPKVRAQLNERPRAVVEVAPLK